MSTALRELSRLFLIISMIGLAFMSSIASTSKAAILDRQKEFFDSIIKRDYSAIDSMVAASYVGTYSLGIFDRPKELADLRQFPLASYEITNSKVVFLNRSNAIIAFRLHVRVVVEGKDIFEDDNINCVWSRRHGKWLLASQTAVKGAQGS
jgi:hypothetical protein